MNKHSGRGNPAPTIMIKEFDIIIIGSGAGGGTVAKELAPLCAKGVRIALIESGGFFTKEHNTRREIEMADKYYYGAGGVQTDQQDLTLAFAEAVGGSTTVYTGTSLTAPQEVFDRWNVPGITLADLKPRYEKYIRENNVHLNSESEINDNNKLFREGCKKLGWHVEQFPVNTRACQGLGTCNLGCAVHAKQGTAAVQIPVAVAQGVELMPFTRVDEIDEGSVSVTVRAPEFGQVGSPLPVGIHHLSAKKIVLAAGTINTPALLDKCFEPSDEFAPALGRYFTCHPALILVGEHPHPISNIHGHPKSFFCDEFMTSDRFLLETCCYFPFTLAKNLVGFGAPVDDLLHHYNHLQMILVLAVDEAEAHNRVYYDFKTGAPAVSYTFNPKTIDSFVKAIRQSAKIFFAAGCERVHAPAAKDFFISKNQIDDIDNLILHKNFKLGKMSISAAHLMGGCRMGTDPKTSVTDSWGRVHGLNGVYVADASLFPKASEVNPYLTIMALADRVAEGIYRDYL